MLKTIVIPYSKKYALFANAQFLKHVEQTSLYTLN